MLAGHVFITRSLQPTANPIRLRFFGANAEILAPDHVARLIMRWTVSLLVRRRDLAR